MRAGRLHLECSRMRRTLFITRHQCFSLREGILTCFSSPSPLRPPCPGLAFCRLGRGSGGRPPFVLPLFFLFFLPKRVRAEVSSLPKSRSGYPFWLKANCDPFRAQARTGSADRVFNKTLTAQLRDSAKVELELWRK